MKHFVAFSVIYWVSNGNKIVKKRLVLYRKRLAVNFYDGFVPKNFGSKDKFGLYRPPKLD